MTLREFSEYYNMTKYADIPVHARPNRKFSDNSANELTKSILAYFEMVGVKAWRESSDGRYLPAPEVKNIMGRTVTLGRGKYIPRSKGAKGMGDISAVIDGLFTSWEVKFGKDRQSDVQKETQKEIENSGGKYYIVKTWEDFIFQVEPLIKSKTRPLSVHRV